MDFHTLPPAPTDAPGTVKIDGKPFVPLAQVAKAKGLKVWQHPRGLLLAGDKEVTFGASEAALLDTTITLFDTPEKFADPDIATRSIPTLKRQGKWTEHVKATPEQLKALEGPEPQWPMTQASAYDLTGFDASQLGSKVPAPGVYPRLLFNEEDIPAIVKRMRAGKPGNMSLIEMEEIFKRIWWNPKTSDGEVFEKLAKGDLAGLEFADGDPHRPWDPAKIFKGQKPGVYHSHISYVPESLASMALYCLLSGNDERGRQAATAIANYYKLREPFIDRQREISDSEFGADPETAGDAETHWRRSFHPGQHMDLAFALDFGGKWMTREQKELMRRVIAKLTYGRRSHGQDGPVRWRDVNWMSWDLTQFLAATAIEGLEGFDKEVYDSGLESARAFLEWGIDEHGQIFESNGKNGGGLQFQILSMAVLARRGENLFGHPHLRKLLEAQVQCVSPNGRLILSGGSFSSSPLSLQAVDELKAFFPSDRCADYLLMLAGVTRASDQAAIKMARWWRTRFVEPATYPEVLRQVMDSVRLPSPAYPAFTRSVVYDTDWKPTTRADLKLPLIFDDPVHGVFSAYSDATPEAAWMAMLVRPNHYLGAGHHHSDAGMFHFSGLGVNWFSETPFAKSYDGKYHNQVIVDGESMPGQFPARAAYLGAVSNKDGAAAAADLTYAYSWRWNTQPALVWDEAASREGWELEPAADILRFFTGAARYKMRPWWPTYNYSNFMPTARAPFNPMKFVYRTVALVRGAHPYGLVVDDLQKDGAAHLYQWTAALAYGVWRADIAGLAANQMVLAWRAPGKNEPEPSGERLPIIPDPFEPLLLVTVLTPSGSGDAAHSLLGVESVPTPPGAGTDLKSCDRLTVSLRSDRAAFQILLTPFRSGERLPAVARQGADTTVTWDDQTDTLRFKTEENRTRAEVIRNGSPILQTK